MYPTSVITRFVLDRQYVAMPFSERVVNFMYHRDTSALFIHAIEQAQGVEHVTQHTRVATQKNAGRACSDASVQQLSDYVISKPFSLALALAKIAIMEREKIKSIA